MNTVNGWLVIEKHGRAVKVQPLTETERYAALRAFGVSDAQAQGIVKGLIVVKVKAGT